MLQPGCRRTILSAAILLLLLALRPAHAQDPRRLPFDFLFKKVDEWTLDYHQARLQNDINQGDAVRVNRDLNRIQRDEWRIWYDRRRIRQDMWLPAGPWVPPPRKIPLDATLVPHPQYPGYGYYPSDPTQLYPLAQSAALPGGAASDGASGNAPPASTPAAATTAAQESVVIVNTGRSGTAIDYAIDGVIYTTEGGARQEVAVGPGSSIGYNRGGDLGEQRYALTPGVYEFRSSNAGWGLFKLRPAAQKDAREPLSEGVPRNDLPAGAGAPKAAASEDTAPDPKLPSG